MNCGKMPSDCGKLLAVVVRPEANADHQEEAELQYDDDRVGQERASRVGEILGAEQPLDDELIGAVRGHGEEGAAEKAGPQRVWVVEYERRIR